MRKIYNSLLAVAGATVLFASCTKESQQAIGTDSTNYFPLKIGKYIVYDVDSIVHSDFTKTSYHNRYQMRYDVVDTFRDAQNRLSYTINVLIRKTSNDEFKPRDVIHVTKDGNKVEWVQTNVRLIKMVFPISESTTWDATSFVTKLDPQLLEYNNYNWTSRYANIDKPFDPGNNPFVQTVTINGVNDKLNEPTGTNYANKNYSQEIYAYGVGLVYKERIYWEYQGTTTKYKKGYELIMKAVEQN